MTLSRALLYLIHYLKKRRIPAVPHHNLNSMRYCPRDIGRIFSQINSTTNRNTAISFEIELAD